MSRRTLIPLIALGVLVFLAISFELARFFNTETQERNAIFALLKAQARGDATAVIARIDGCASDPACRATATRNAARLRRRGEVKILAYDSKTAYALGDKRGPTRVAWTVIDNGLPVVQCVEVERTGNFLSGLSVAVLSVSRPISNEGDC